MEQERYYFRVGVFVTITLVALTLIASWFATNRQKETFLTYAIFFEGSVDGLSRGAPVRLKGIEVGNVKDISFASYENDLIRVLVDIIDSAPIRTDTYASLQIQGITGTSLISLENTGKNPEYIRREEGEAYMTIKSKQSSLEKVVTSVPELLDELTTLSQQAQKLLSDQNIRSVNLAIAELRTMLAEGKVTMREIKMLAKTLREDPSKLIRGPKYEGYKIDAH